MLAKEIRKTFIDYFNNNGHEIITSSSLIPANDPTLLFTNAGMVQFKDLFLGLDQKPYKRAVSSQKCVRAGGKHNDLEMVGRTARHHTFFEMLGNFSFGDYFKVEAIKMGWEFLTEILKLPENLLWVTVFQDDDEAFDIWHKVIKIPNNRIVRLGKADNFWTMGEIGPCGPCSEILFDQGSDIGCKKPTCEVGCDCDRFMELWNLVFMQFDKDKEGNVNLLPNPSIDTGMGLERVSAILQGENTNFNCDLFRPIIANLEDEFSKKYGISERDDIALRVISDHIRASTFLINDEIMPSNEGRGYVLRRIIRRALRYGKILGKDKPFLFKIVNSVVNIMKDAYPELINKKEFISKILLSEEENFETTLNFGINILEDIIKKTKNTKSEVISGEELFKLYDTYGFPIDLAADIAEDAGLLLDKDGFDRAMSNQKEMARFSWKGSSEKSIKPIYKEIVDKIKESKFEGYQNLKLDGKILYIIKEDQNVDVASRGDEIELLFDVTPFYGESGGQVGDVGKGWNDGASINIVNTLKPLSGIIVHKCVVLEGTLKTGEKLTLQVDNKIRKSISLNHTATHLLHSTLKEVLGSHVKQSGSLVNNHRLRFDYSHFSPVRDSELNKIEYIINEKIRDNFFVITEELHMDDAIKKGATALFGEKYGELVRMVQMGNYSNELCGGTHAKGTGDIGMFKIVSETGIASGVRRIEALTGEGAYEYIKQKEELLLKIQKLMKASSQDLFIKLKKNLEYTSNLEKELEQFKQKVITENSDDLYDKVKKINGVSVLVIKFENLDIKSLRSFIDNAKNKLKTGIVVAGTVISGKVILAAGVTKDLMGKYHAGNILKEIALVVDGAGGGRADMAQAGGKNPLKLQEALDKVYEIIA